MPCKTKKYGLCKAESIQHNFLPSPSISTTLFPWDLKRLSPSVKLQCSSRQWLQANKSFGGGAKRERERKRGGLEQERISEWESWQCEHRMRVQAKHMRLQWQRCAVLHNRLERERERESKQHGSSHCIITTHEDAWLLLVNTVWCRGESRRLPANQRQAKGNRSVTNKRACHRTCSPQPVRFHHVRGWRWSTFVNSHSSVGTEDVGMQRE